MPIHDGSGNVRAIGVSADLEPRQPAGLIAERLPAVIAADHLLHEALPADATRDDEAEEAPRTP